MNIEVFSFTGTELDKQIEKIEKKRESNAKNAKTWSGDLDRFLNRHVFQSSRKRAQQAGLRFDLSLQQVVSMWHHQNGICPGTGVEMTYVTDSPLRASLDQIVAGKGYTIDNVWLTTQGFNFMKNKFNLLEVSQLVTNSKTPLFEKVLNDYINHRPLTHNSDLLLI